MKNLKVNLTYLEQFILECDEELKEMVANEIMRIKKEIRGLPGIGGETFQIELNKNQFFTLATTKEYVVMSKPKSPMYQRILNWITFGLYKPNSFAYDIKNK